MTYLGDNVYVSGNGYISSFYYGLARWLHVKNPPANAGDVGSIPGPERPPWEGNCHTLQYCCLENSMDRGTWWAAVHEVAKSWT